MLYVNFRQCLLAQAQGRVDGASGGRVHSRKAKRQSWKVSITTALYEALERQAHSLKMD